jgi:hypothetical protein
MHDPKQAKVRTVGGHGAGILRAGSRASAEFPHGRTVRTVLGTFSEKTKRVSKQEEGEERNKKIPVPTVRTVRRCELLGPMRVAGAHRRHFPGANTMRTVLPEVS